MRKAPWAVARCSLLKRPAASPSPCWRLNAQRRRCRQSTSQASPNLARRMRHAVGERLGSCRSTTHPATPSSPPDGTMPVPAGARPRDLSRDDADLHNAWPARGRRSDRQGRRARPSLASFFFRSGQSPLDAPSMHRDAELLLHGGDQVRSGIGRDGPLDKCHDLLGQLVSASRPPLLRYQRAQATAREGLLSLIEGRTRKTKKLRCSPYGEVVAVNATQHFVFHLQEVVRVEKVAAREQF